MEKLLMLFSSICKKIYLGLGLFGLCLSFSAVAEEAWSCPDQGWKELQRRAIDETYTEEVQSWVETPGLDSCNVYKAEAWFAERRAEAGDFDAVIAELEGKIWHIEEPLASIPLIFSLGFAYQQKGDYALEREQYQKVLALPLPPSMAINRAYSYLLMAQSYRKANNSVSAISWARQALTEPSLLENAELYTEALLTATSIYLSEQLLDPALSVLLEAVKLEDKLPHSPYTFSFIYDYLALVEWHRGGFDASLHYAIKSEGYCSQYKSDRCEYYAHIRQGSAYSSLGQLDKAEKAFEVAQRHLPAISTKPLSVQFFYLEYANLLSLQGHSKEAKEALDKALSFGSIKEDKVQFFRAYNQKRVAEIYSNLKMYKQASEWAYSYAEALNEWQTQRNSSAITSMFDELSEAQHQKELSDIEKKTEQTQKALELAEVERAFQLKVQFYQSAALLLLLVLAGYSLYNRQKWKQLAKFDSLTQVLSRGPMMHAVNKLSSKGNRSYAVVLFDLDLFKKINDDYGHPTGDLVLRVVAERVRGSLKQGDLFGRIGGEEFLLFIPFENSSDIQHFAERILEVVRHDPVVSTEGDITVTASFGVSLLTPEDGDFSSAYVRADKALYEAKEAGRNRVVYSEEVRA